MTSIEYLYSPTALGRKTSQHDCKANAENLLTKTKLRKSRLKQNDRNQKKNLQDLKAETLGVCRRDICSKQRNCERAGRTNSKIKKPRSH